MNPSLKVSLEDYIRDTKERHAREHSGTFETCPCTECQLARGIETGHVPEKVYQAVVKGDREVSQ